MTSKMLLMALILAVGSLTGFAQNAMAADITCTVAVTTIDKKSPFGAVSEDKETTVVLQKLPTANYGGYAITDFLGGDYKVAVNFEVGEVDLAKTWSTMVAVLYKVDAGKNKVLGSVMIPNEYHGKGRIAPTEVWVGNGETFDKIANEPGVFGAGKLDFVKLAPFFNNGDVIGAGVACYPK